MLEAASKIGAPSWAWAQIPLGGEVTVVRTIKTAGRDWHGFMANHAFWVEVGA